MTHGDTPRVPPEARSDPCSLGTEGRRASMFARARWPTFFSGAHSPRVSCAGLLAILETKSVHGGPGWGNICARARGEEAPGARCGPHMGLKGTGDGGHGTCHSVEPV